MRPIHRDGGMGLEILDGRHQELPTVLEVPEAMIAGVAEERPDPSTRVTVIDQELPPVRRGGGRTPADRAEIALRPDTRLIVGDVDPIIPLQRAIPLAPAADPAKVRNPLPVPVLGEELSGTGECRAAPVTDPGRAHPADRAPPRTPTPRSGRYDSHE